MVEIRHACADGLTPECFEKYPQYAKKVFAYRLMHTLCPARMTRKLRESLWRILTEYPLSWVPPEYFIFPPGFTWEMLFPEDWTPEDPLPEGVTIDPAFRFTIEQLKLMYVFIEPGKIWESVFPNGWDPNTPLPDGASWTPYYTLPAFDPAGEQSVEPMTPEQLQDAVFAATGTRPPRQPLTATQMRRGNAAQYGTDSPLYMGPWTPGPVHRTFAGPPVEVLPWFYEPWDTFDTDIWTDNSDDPGYVEISNNMLKMVVPGDTGRPRVYHEFAEDLPVNYDLSWKLNISPGCWLFKFGFRSVMHTIHFEFYPPNELILFFNEAPWTLDLGNYENQTYTYKLSVRGNNADFYRDDILIAGERTLWETGPQTPYLYPLCTSTTGFVAYLDEIIIMETE